MHILKIIHGYPSLYNAGSKGWANYGNVYSSSMAEYLSR